MIDVRTLSVAVVLAALAAPVGAVTLNYTDFSSTAGLQLNGSTAAATEGTAPGRRVLRLTPALTGQSGSAFSTDAITLGASYSFSTAFTFNINNDGGSGGGADGFVFTLQTVSNTAGAGGGGIGYQGLPRSVGVEFDTFNNGELNDNHIAVDLNGDVNNSDGNGSPAVAAPYMLKEGGDLTAFIDYNGTTLDVRLSNNGLRPAAALLSYNVDLAAVLGSRNAYVGFTSGTGGGYANHDIVNWTFADSFAPIGLPSAAPEPASWAMMVAGFGLVGAGLRRRRGVLRLA